jgi:hypothetical protein
MPYATCQDCGKAFWRDVDETWKRRCLSCWKASKGREKKYLAVIAGLSERVGELEMTLEQFRDSDLAPWIPKLLQLTHPDRHDNSALSTEVTQWLLNQRTR